MQPCSNQLNLSYRAPAIILVLLDVMAAAGRAFASEIGIPAIGATLPRPIAAQNPFVSALFGNNAIMDYDLIYDSWTTCSGKGVNMRGWEKSLHLKRCDFELLPIW